MPRQHTLQAREAVEPQQIGSALYQRVKHYVSRQIAIGDWKAGDRIPSELVLVKQFGVSRMTVHRALRELAQKGQIVRKGGVGTFVADQRAESALVTIADVPSEIARRGNRHSCDYIVHCAEPAAGDVASTLQLDVGDTVYHTVCVHHENDVAVQLEDRYVSPRAAPGYGDQQFIDEVPAVWLLRNVALTEIEHTVEASVAGPRERELLRLAPSEPCLVLRRLTWSGSAPVTLAHFIHPGFRYRLNSRYSVDWPDSAA